MRPAASFSATRRARRGSARPRDTILMVGIVVLLTVAGLRQHFLLTSLEYRHQLFEQRLQLPPTEVLRFLTLGYDNVYANWLWLQSIQAFGSGWITEDGTTKPIYRYFDTLTDVDPKFISAYRFANLIIADNRHDWDLGRQILEKGSLQNPFNYDLPYLGIYSALWQYDNEIDARWFASRLNRIPSTPGFMVRLTEYIERRVGRYEAAYEFNVRYMLEYLHRENELERDIVYRRVQNLIDRWNKRELGQAAQRFHEEHGRHPELMEELLDGGYLEPFDAPVIEAFRAASEMAAAEMAGLPRDAEVPDHLVEQAAGQSMVHIVGLPPDPNGFWYLINEPSAIYRNMTGEEIDNWERLPYMVSAQELSMEMDRNSMQAQQFIMEYHAEHDGALPSDEEMERFYGRDPLGGHYRYDRDAPESPTYGVFYSTATRRINDGREPRIGLHGPGPFGLPLQPTLSENDIDREWGIENGYIDEDGNELWFLPGEEPWLIDIGEDVLVDYDFLGIDGVEDEEEAGEF